MSASKRSCRIRPSRKVSRLLPSIARNPRRESKSCVRLCSSSDSSEASSRFNISALRSIAFALASKINAFKNSAVDAYADKSIMRRIALRAASSALIPASMRILIIRPSFVMPSVILIDSKSSMSARLSPASESNAETSSS